MDGVTPAPTELRRVLEALAAHTQDKSSGVMHEQLCALDFADAARLLREKAADFAAFAWHTDASLCEKDVRTETDCTCGLRRRARRVEAPVTCPFCGKRIKARFRLYDTDGLPCGDFCSRECAESEAWGPNFATFRVQKLRPLP